MIAEAWEATTELRYARYRDESGHIVGALQQKFVSEWHPFEEWRNIPVVDVDRHPYTISEQE